MKKIFLLLAAFLILTAFSTDQKNYDQEIKILADKLFKELSADKEVQVLKENLNLEQGEVPFKYYVNKNFVKENEKKALEKFQNYRARAQKEMLRIEQKYFPFNVPFFEKLFAATFSVFMDLYEGKITYGQYYKITKDLFEKSKEYAREAYKHAQSNQPNQFDRIHNAFRDYLITQKLINDVFQPTRKQTFTCVQNGNITNCW